MDGKHVFLPRRLSGITGGLDSHITGGLDSHRAFSRSKFPPTNLSFRQLPANNPSFPVLSATNSDVPDSFSGSESPATNCAGVWDGGISEHRSNLPQNSDGGLDSCAFPIGQTNDLGLLGSRIGQEGLYPPQNIDGGLDSCAFPIGQTDDLGLLGSGIGRDGLYPSHNVGVWDGGIYGHGFNLPQNSGPGFSATNSCAPNFPDFPATNFAGVWDGGIYEHRSNLPQISDNTLEALIHVSPSLRISPKEAIGVQIENTRSESVEILPIEEVMPVDSSAQKPIGANKGKRTGRTKIEIALEDMLKYKTVKEAALNLNVSESTVDRRIKDHTGGPWSIAKRRGFARKPMTQDKNPVLVKVAYEGTKTSFEMPWTPELGELHSLVESSLKLEAGTYDIQYFDGAEYISIACDANLLCCFANAPRSPRSNSILLNLTSRH